MDDPPAPGDGPEQRTLDGPDDDETERYRVWVARGGSPDGAVTVLVGRSLESVEEATRTLRTSLLLGVPLLLALLALVTWTVVGRALARIDDITTTVADIDGRDLDRRVAASGVDDEVGRLATTMNRMLDRLAEAARRQRDFVADASHDLQSPLTALRTELEVALANPYDVDVASWARGLLASSTEMELLVQDLVALAVLEAGTDPLGAELLDLDELVLEEAARARPATGVAIDTVGVSAAPVRGDPVALRRLARNLLDNAVAHAARRVVVTLRAEPDAVVLEVVDDGPGVADEDRERVFDRFFRGDPVRRHGGGSGLGLAIARQVAQRHGGALDLVGHADGAPTSRFRLVLPPADPRRSPTIGR